MMEEWRDIPGYEGFYQVSSCGQVRSYDRMVATTLGGPAVLPGRVMKQTAHPDGYMYVWLNRPSEKRRSEKVHRLVLKAFIDVRDSDWHVDHINAERADNRLENLRWVRLPENARNRQIPYGMSGAIGVHRSSSALKPWRALVCRDYVKHHIGCFATIEEAAAARREYIEQIDGAAA